MLLDEIIEFATDNRKSISVLLRKCLILAHRVGNERLAVWATSELNGYPLEQQLPEYRILQAPALGHMTGPFGAAIKNLPIPASLLEERHRVFATRVHLRQPISAYEDMAGSSNPTFTIKWPADLVLYYQDEVVTENGCYLADAWQPIGKSSLVQMIDAVRNRTLALALELQRTVGSRDEELVNMASNKAEKIEKTVVNNIYGGTNVVSFGNAKVAATVNQEETLTIAQGDTEALHRALRNVGLSESDVNALSGAMASDRSMGVKVRSWVTDVAKKVLNGGVQVGTQVGAAVLTEFLKRYYGLS